MYWNVPSDEPGDQQVTDFLIKLHFFLQHLQLLKNLLVSDDCNGLTIVHKSSHIVARKSWLSSRNSLREAKQVEINAKVTKITERQSASSDKKKISKAKGAPGKNEVVQENQFSHDLEYWRNVEEIGKTSSEDCLTY
ncbi:hypothetical protein TYRP_015685 [Tyrophagus putrescentiae]|nr:hypothetical protein TYRP_015685 [Tyrophagus putrescentiae]